MIHDFDDPETLAYVGVKFNIDEIHEDGRVHELEACN